MAVRGRVLDKLERFFEVLSIYWCQCFNDYWMIGSTGRSRSPVCDFCGKNRHFSRLGRCGNGRDGSSAGKNKKKSSFRENTIPPLLYMRVAVLCVFCLLFLSKYYIYYIIKSKTDRQDRTEQNKKSGNMAKLASNTWSMLALCEALIKQYLIVNPSYYWTINYI